jgi:hypothetical protein
MRGQEVPAETVLLKGVKFVALLRKKKVIF